MMAILLEAHYVPPSHKADGISISTAFLVSNIFVNAYKNRGRVRVLLSAHMVDSASATHSITCLVLSNGLKLVSLIS